ncbi:MAG TPA: flagellar filament capping protein FliD [Paenibacillus sp.]|jgi:flagellar hook-associated protein 2
MRINGLSSGMNIDDMVKQLMTAKRVPLDKMNQNKQVLEWRRDSYKEVNSALVDFRNNKLSKYRNISEMNAFTSDVTGNKSAISVKATPSAKQIPMEVEVVGLATQATFTSKVIEGGTSTTLKSLGVSGASTFNIKGGSSIEFAEGDTIQNVLDKLNGDSSSSVTATFDEASKRIVIKSKEFGNSGISFEGDKFMDGLKTPVDPDAPVDNKAGFLPGAAAKVMINGTEHNPTSNTLTVNGVEITLLAKSGAENSTITTNADGNKTLNTIKSFLANYNDLIGTLNGKISEQKYKDFQPLTSEQRADMKEDDIKNWDKKAKSGLLRGDDIIRESLSQMRGLIMGTNTKVGDKTLSLASIGITTGSYTENGQLYLDEEKLKKAIAENPEQISEMFSSSKEGGKGLFDKMYDKLNDSLTKMSAKAGTNKFNGDITLSLNEQSTMGKELKDMNTRIYAFASRMKTWENNYYTQFTAMEKAINKMNSQSASLASFAG